MFRTVPLSIIRSFSLYIQHWHMLYRFADNCEQTCITCTIAVCTAKNSWWWTEELSETCTVSFKNKFEKLVRLVGFIVRKVPWYKVFHSACTKTANMARMYEILRGPRKRSIQANSLILLHLHSPFPFSDTLTVIVPTRSLSSIAPIRSRNVTATPAVPLRLNGFT